MKVESHAQARGTPTFFGGTRRRISAFAYGYVATSPPFSQWGYRGLPCLAFIHGQARAFLLRQVKNHHLLRRDILFCGRSLHTSPLFRYEKNERPLYYALSILHSPKRRRYSADRIQHFDFTRTFENDASSSKDLKGRAFF